MIILYNIATPYNVSNISSFFAFFAGRNRPWVGKRGLLLMTCNTILALFSMSWTYIHGIHSIIRNHMQYMLVLTRAKIQHLWKSHAWMYAKLEIRDRGYPNPKYQIKSSMTAQDEKRQRYEQYALVSCDLLPHFCTKSNHFENRKIELCWAGPMI